MNPPMSFNKGARPSGRFSDRLPFDLRSGLKAALLASAFAAGIQLASAQMPTADELIKQAEATLRKDDVKGALALLDKAVIADPKNLNARVAIARLRSGIREYDKAAEAWTEVMKLAPLPNAVLLNRGMELFRAGKIKECLVDFDKFNEALPQRAPDNWQRGIALYYAGRFADGKKQFEIHQTVNKNDVENAVWHFLCTTRAENLAEARHHLIPITGDSRVPMKEIQMLFAGKAKPEDVLAAAKSGEPAPDKLGHQLFYANLYLGIYFEAIGEDAKARDYIFKAAEGANENGYMGDVARVHADILKKAGKK